MNKRFNFRLNGISVLMLLIMLCIAVFSVLTLVSTASQLALSRKSSEHSANRAAADAAAQTRIATLVLESDSLFEEDETDASRVLSFETAVFGNVKISVVLTVFSDGEYQITQYKTVNAGNGD